MYSVLIADDEEIIRTELERAFRWEDFDMQVTAVARNGREALDLVKQFRPDVCLLDVKMPFLNGLELIEEINKVDSSIVKIIISGYDEFEFAQKAIRLGVYNYVLKPIDEEDFCRMMLEVRDRLRTNSELDQQQKLRNALLENNRELLQTETFYKWIRGEISPAAAEESLKDFGIHFSGSYDLYYIRLRFRIGYLGDEDYMEQSLQECRDMFLRQYCGPEKYYSVRMAADTVVVLASRSENRSAEISARNGKLSGSENWKAEVYHRITMNVMDDVPALFLELQKEAAVDEGYSTIVYEIRQYIHENYQDPQLRLSHFADKNHVSLSTVSRLFKKETGMTFMDYLISYRIRNSIDLLENTGLRIVEIAERVGYSSQHYYCDAFKNVMGISPTRYRSRKK